jgi:hypothetical protein
MLVVHADADPDALAAEAARGVEPRRTSAANLPAVPYSPSSQILVVWRRRPR